MRMRERSLDACRESLTHVGAMLPLSVLLALNRAFNYLWVGHWLTTRGFRIPRRIFSREAIFEEAAAEIGNDRVLYLEFGVYRGESLQTWSRLLRNPESQLYGFDSFEGLPETWDLDTARGHFSTQGRLPAIDDDRVMLVVGWFDDTLQNYTVPPHDQLFITLDADLYSSTRTVLKFLAPHVRVGTYIYFDEFQSREHELRAFDEFLQETGLEFRVVVANRALSQILFQCIAVSPETVAARRGATEPAAREHLPAEPS